MIKLLLVDDQQDEREGIRFLIDRYRFDLDVVEMSNGEDAFHYLLDNHVDLLLTDIKMPFMDGLELARRARSLDEQLKIVIFSAHGEFEYAKRAIPYKVEHYILKPIEVGEFVQVMEQTIRSCEQTQELKRQEYKIQQTIRLAVQSEKRELLRELINSAKIDDRLQQRLVSSGLHDDLAGSIMVLVDFGSRLFDADGLDFESVIRECVPGEPIIVNLHEFQSVVFFNNAVRSEDTRELNSLGEKLKTHLRSRFAVKLCIVMAGRIDAVDEIYDKFQMLDSMLEHRFFIEEDAVFLLAYDRSGSNKDKSAAGPILEAFYDEMRSGQHRQAEKGIERFFSLFSESGLYSSSIVKYQCTELAKLLLSGRNSHQLNSAVFQKIAERIYEARHIDEIKSVLLELAETAEDREASDLGNKTTNKGIGHIMDIIHGEYMNDLGLEYIAEKVYMSPGYVSNLFKKETGQSFMRALTTHRLLKAQELLRETNMKVADISRGVGYPNPSYFCNLFKSQFGVSPAQYRERG